MTDPASAAYDLSETLLNEEVYYLSQISKAGFVFEAEAIPRLIAGAKALRGEVERVGEMYNQVLIKNDDLTEENARLKGAIRDAYDEIDWKPPTTYTDVEKKVKAILLAALEGEEGE